MLTRFIRKFSVIAICFSVFSGVYADENINDKPVYQGQVLAIDKPMSIRFSPYPESVMTNKTTTVVVTEGARLESVSNSIGSSQIMPKDGNLEMLISIDKTETLVAGETQIQPVDMQLSLLMTPLGKFLDSDVTSTTIPAAELAIVKGMVEGIIKQAVAQLPKEGVTEGHQFINEADMGFGDMLSIATVLGQTTYNKRPALVVDFEGSKIELNIGEQYLGGDVKGYALMDVATGIWSYSEVSMFVPMGANLSDSMTIHQLIDIDLK